MAINANTKAEIVQLMEQGEVIQAYELLTEPLHEALYRSQTFDLLEKLPVGERVALAFDYIRSQVDAGGFIQLIQNGYVSLVLTVIEGLQELNIADEIADVLDNVLRVYVLNVDILSKETSVDEFAKLYNEFKEFDLLEEGFESEKINAITEITRYCLSEEK